MIEHIIDKLLSYGLPGVFTAILLWKNWDLTRRMREIEDARHAETIQYLNAFSDIKVLLSTMTSEIRGKLESLKDALRKD